MNQLGGGKKNQPESVSAPQPPRRNTVVICLLLVAAVFMVFGQTARHEFINMDDGQYVTENPHIRGGLTWQSVRWVSTAGLAHNDPNADYWQPLSLFSHALDIELFGLQPAGHHLMNVGLHAAAAVALFLVLQSMTNAPWRCAFVAALFALHPLRVESVAWVTERKDVLSGLFFMLTLGAYTRYVRGPFSLSRYLTVVFVFALGLMSKPMLVTLPFVLLLLDYWPLQRIPRTASGSALGALRPLIIEKIPLLALSATSCMVTVLGQGEAVAPIEKSPVALRIGNSAVSYIGYLGKMAFPIGLGGFYPLSVNDMVIWKAGVALVLLAGITAGVVLLRRTRPYLLVGWLWYVGMLVPVIGLLQSEDPAPADRFTYLPQIGVCLLVVWAVWDMVSSRRYGRLLLGFAAVSVITALMVCATIQTSYWHDSESLWIHALSCTFRNYAAHNNLANALAVQGRSAEAIAQYQKALAIKPDFKWARYSLANVLAAQGRTAEAIAQYQKALEISPDFAEARYNLANVLAGQGRTAEAIAQYQKAVVSAPNAAEAHNNLGTVLLGQGRPVEAIEQYQKALEISPDFAEARYNLANALAAQGRIAEAIEQYQQALRIKPDYEEVRNNLANALAAQGRSTEAIAQYQKTLEHNPNNAEAHNNLGTVLLGQGRSAEAIEQYQKALEIRPDFAQARYNLGNVLAAQGRTAEAIEQYQQVLRIKPDYAQARNKLERLQAGKFTGGPP